MHVTYESADQWHNPNELKNYLQNINYAPKFLEY